MPESTMSKEAGREKVMPAAAATPGVPRPAAVEQAARERAARQRVAREKAAAEDSSSERELMQREAAEAKAAIRRVIKETRESVGTAVDIRLWTKKSPWIALGLAAGAGLATAVLVRRGGKLAASNGEATTATQPAATAKPAEPTPAHAGLGAKIAESLFDMAKLALETAIMTGIRESAARKSHTNGQCEETVSHEP